MIYYMQVEELFVPRLTAFNTTSRYAFSSHFDQHGLSRFLTSMGWAD